MNNGKKRSSSSKIREMLDRLNAEEPLHYEPATARIINYKPKDNKEELNNFFKRLEKQAEEDTGFGMSKKIVAVNGHSFYEWIEDSLENFDDPRTQVTVLLEIIDMVCAGIPDRVAQQIFFKCMGIERHNGGEDE